MIVYYKVVLALPGPSQQFPSYPGQLVCRDLVGPLQPSKTQPNQPYPIHNPSLEQKTGDFFSRHRIRVMEERLDFFHAQVIDFPYCTNQDYVSTIVIYGQNYGSRYPIPAILLGAKNCQVLPSPAPYKNYTKEKFEIPTYS